MKLHPVAHVVIVLDLVLVTFCVPVIPGLAILGAFCAAVLITPSRTGTRLAGPFLKLILFAAVFLVLLHGIQWRPLQILPAGMREAAGSFRLIASVVVSILYLARQITGEEMYALFLDFRIPPSIILILFRTLWLVPRFIERIDEVVLAQKLRGMPVDSAFSRARAVVPSFTPIFASMLEETFEQAMIITIRGFLEPGLKTHTSVLAFRGRDWMVIIFSVLITVMILAYRF